jgi:steroid delta-isomerase-like uncharacterized protein
VRASSTLLVLAAAAACNEAKVEPRLVEEPAAAATTPAASASAPWTQTATTVAFAKQLLEAANARDAGSHAPLPPEDAPMRDSKARLGRVWVGPSASVLEYVLTGTRRAGELQGVKVGERPVGINAAMVVILDGDGHVKTQRDYFDVATTYGQVEPKLLPPGFDKVRPAAAAVLPAGSDVLEPKGTPEESANLDVMNKVFLAFDAHAIDDALAFFADDFVLEDFTAPGPQKKAEVRKHALAVLGAMPDFKIVRAVTLPAGDDVVVESSVQGTFTAAMGPVQPTGQPVTVHQLDVWRLKAGKVVRQWSYSNNVEVLTQLGVSKR